MRKKAPAALGNPFVALRHRNFKIYFTGMCVSMVGTWMQNIAQPWLAYSLTQSPLLLSLVGILQFLPVTVFSLLAGDIIDRYPTKRILYITQISSLAITLALAVLVFTGHVQYWHILLSATALGFANTLNMPARQSFVIELVEKQDLTAAISLNSTLFNIARIAGPALAGIIMSTLGIAYCFAINSLSFGAVIVSLFFIHPAAIPKTVQAGRKAAHRIREGLSYIFHDPLLLRTLLTVLIVATFAMNFNVLVPVFSDLVLNQQESGFGFLMTFMGVGSFLGALLVAARSKAGPSKTVMSLFPFFLAAAITAVGFTGAYWATAAGLAASGFFFVAYASSANSTLQLQTRDEYRGRVMSAFTMVFAGSTPAGNLYAGIITDTLGPAAGFIACGAVILILLFFVVFIRKKKGGAPNK